MTREVFLLWLFVCMLPAQDGQNLSIPKPASDPGNLLTVLLGPSGKTKTPIATANVPGVSLATERLQRPTCSSFVGGSLAVDSAKRLREISFFALQKDMPTAAEIGGRTLLVYAVFDGKSIDLLPGFFDPHAVNILMSNGQLRTIDSVPGFARTHSIKGLTTESLQALVIIHELMHSTGTAMVDIRCMIVSMLNTYRVVENCFPELLDEFASPAAAAAENLRLTAGAEGSQFCNDCHSRMGVAYRVPDPPIEAYSAKTPPVSSDLSRVSQENAASPAQGEKISPRPPTSEAKVHIMRAPATGKATQPTSGEPLSRGTGTSGYWILGACAAFGLLVCFFSLYHRT